MTMYEVRQVDNPGAMPLGSWVLSRHRTPEAAERAIRRDSRRFFRSDTARFSPGSYLPPRIIVAVDHGAVRRLDRSTISLEEDDR